MSFEGSFERGRRICLVECLRRTVPIIRKRFSPNVFVFTRGVTKVQVSDTDRKCLLDCNIEEDPTYTEGMCERWT